MPITNYRWAASHNVALGSLSFVENDLKPYMRLRIGAPRSQPVDPFPVRTMVQAGYELGDGRIDHTWDMVISTTALEFIIEVKFSLTSVVSTPATIYTRRHDRNDFARYNAYVTLPKPGQDVVYVRQNVVRVSLRFTGLIAL